MKDLAIVIVNWNTVGPLNACLESILADPDNGEAQITVVDNASTDGSAKKVSQRFPRVAIIKNDENLGYTCANNQGIAATKSDYVLLLNSDTLVPRGTVSGLLGFIRETPDAGAVAPRLLLEGGTPQPYAFGGDPSPFYLIARDVKEKVLHQDMHNWADPRVRTVDWASGACLLLRRDALEMVGGLDEGFFMYFEDVDLCRRMRQQGWNVYVNPQLAITHLGGRSLCQRPSADQVYFRSLKYFYNKHYGRLALWALSEGLIFLSS
jgi:GT2 family glycosyltransferase